MAKVTDVTKEYAEKAKGQGTQIAYEDGYRQTKHKNEIHAAEWLMDAVNGNIASYGLELLDKVY